MHSGGRIRPAGTLEEARNRVHEQLSKMRPDHVRPLNPTPYKVSLDASMYDFMHQLWMDMAPISDLA
jgi:nicotinate phosphoribosyltransferase